MDSQNKVVKVTEGDSSESNQVQDKPKRKMAKQGLYVREGRMFVEKFYFLNKSTTKYVIVGMDPESCQPLVRICDRSSGFHVSIPGREFDSFAQQFGGKFNGLFDSNKFRDSTVNVQKKNNFYWITEITDDEGEKTVILHVISATNLENISTILCDIVAEYQKDCVEYGYIIKDIMAKPMDPDFDAVANLKEFLDEEAVHSKKYNILADLIIHADYFSTLQKFKELYNNK